MTSLDSHTDNAAPPILAIGLMSGTSADGVDAALIRTDGQALVEFIAGVTLPYDSTLRRSLLAAAHLDAPLTDVLRLERALTNAHVEACRELLSQAAGKVRGASDVQIVGFHGHTLRHVADERMTWQIGDASWLAEQLSIPVVGDFRRRDLAAGGQGAPLAALYHRQLLVNQDLPAAILNLGGVANLTWVGADDELLAGDVGPGCGLLDAWTAATTGEPFDRDGRLAQAGRVDEPCVRQALKIGYFSRPLPKSADRYDFDDIDVRHLSSADGAATLCAITAEATARCVAMLPAPPRAVWVTGGGVHHAELMRMLAERLPKLHGIEVLGQRPDSLEAECFAWLAVRRVRSLPTTAPGATGCRRITCGGSLTT
jgi:anhydro-N-acetylmuramic acid kinase